MPTPPTHQSNSNLHSDHGFIDLWCRVFEEYTRHACTYYKGMTVSMQPYWLSMYRRFLYATLSPGVLITPAALMRNSNASDQTALCMPHLTVHPETGELLQMHYNTIFHTIEDHPVFSDLKILRTLFVTPRDHDRLSEWATAEVLEHFSLPDVSYLDFLIRVALNLLLLIPMPSLYTTMVQAASDAQAADFDRLPPREALKRIVTAVLEDCAAQISDCFPDAQVDAPGLEAVLHDPLHFDTFQNDAFTANDKSSLSVLAELWSATDPLELFQEAFPSRLYLFGIQLDKFFYTPLSFFLRLIQPVYAAQKGLPRAFRSLRGELTPFGYLDSALYAPVLSHCFTPMGADLFEADENRYHPADLPITDISGIIADVEGFLAEGGELLRAETIAAVPMDIDVYTITAAWTQNPDFHATLQVVAHTPIRVLHQHLARVFTLHTDSPYSFFSGAAPSPFIEYTDGNGAMQKSTNTAFADFCPEGGAFCYCTSSYYGHYLPDAESDIISLSLTVTDVKKAEYGFVYPTHRQSEALSEWHDAVVPWE